MAGGVEKQVGSLKCRKVLYRSILEGHRSVVGLLHHIKSPIDAVERKTVLLDTPNNNGLPDQGANKPQARYMRQSTCGADTNRIVLFCTYTGNQHGNSSLWIDRPSVSVVPAVSKQVPVAQGIHPQVGVLYRRSGEVRPLLT